MLTKVKTATLDGVEGTFVTVETDLRRGMPSFTVVGLADTTIREACSRIKPAVLNSGYDFPDERVTVNLAPAGKPKEGTHFDLPIAVGLVVQGWATEVLTDTAFLGELSLDGKLNSIKGAMPLVLCLRNHGIKRVILPVGNAEEAAVIKDMEIMAAHNLKQVVDHVIGKEILSIYKGKKRSYSPEWDMDFAEVIGQEQVKRAVVIGAAGNHGILLMGGPGCGKTMIAKRIPTILPELTYEEMLEVTGIYSVAGKLTETEPVIGKRPFRNPHHTISIAGLLGGGTKPKPGEMSLAHRGVLFLDEFGEFDIKVIDAMRQPVEEGFIKITRNNREVVFPSEIMLVAAANPCKCGQLWDERKICTCSHSQVENYMRKLNGPFSDRIDMHIKMLPIDIPMLNDINRQSTINSDMMRSQVESAAKIQRARYKGTKYHFNGCLDEKGVEQYCQLDSECRKVLYAAYERLGISMRACSRMIKVARTIADIEESEIITPRHITEALMYRITDGEKGIKI